MLFLTYHKIDQRDSPDFYTVRADVLREHLELLKRAQKQPANIESLLDKGKRQDDYFVTFDDGTADHFELVMPILEEFEIKGIFFVPTDKIQRAGSLSRAQLLELSSRGHEIGCHSHKHMRLDTQSDESIREQLTVSTEIIAQLTGKMPRILAPPGGFTSHSVRRISGELGMPLVRTMKWGLNRALVLDDLETIPVNRKFSCAKLEGILNAKGLARLRLLYNLKEAAKTLVPLRLYERVRNVIFRR